MLLKCRVALTGIGHFLPDTVLNNDAVISRGNLPYPPEWISKRIGVERRHVLAPDKTTSDMAIEAAHQALQHAALSPDDLDLVLLSTISPDHPSPATACAVQAALGNYACPAFDLSAACSGFVYALDTGVRHVLTGARHVLVISAETRSRFVNPKDPKTAAIFGDGAGAVVLSKVDAENAPKMIVRATDIKADGRGFYSVYTPAGGAKKPASAQTVEKMEHFIQMPNGEQIFFQVVESMVKYTHQFLKDIGLTLDDVDYILPHQANLNILQEVQRQMDLPVGKMLLNIQDVGNMSSASIPVLLSQSYQKIGPNKNVIFLAVGAGHTMGLAWIQT